MKAEMSAQKSAGNMTRLLPEPLEVRRTPAEKARILVRLTLALAALDVEERRSNGNT